MTITEAKEVENYQKRAFVSHRSLCNKVCKAEIREQNEKECECVFGGAWGMVK